LHGNPHSVGEHEPLPPGAFRFQGLLTHRERAFGTLSLSFPFQNGIGLLERLRPLSRVLAFSHPLREQHASRSWDWHLTCFGKET